ncbi:hypothetical protein VTK73DRAFT_5567 [Phialemonium thermophilum]|uniref:Heterokaryon incompatibility domain-containing protein n=1 Tax=Phialemonium thermophilum TaxID=223376 RepID=A0ABR3XX33_9PEZI
MAYPSTLCSACLGILEAGLEEVMERKLCAKFTHHSEFTGFRKAVESDCFICVKLWDFVSETTRAVWARDPTSWTPWDCRLERRAWAPETYGAIYWHIVYMVFSPGAIDFQYKGNVFCLFPNNGEPTAHDDDLEGFESSTSSAKVHEQAYNWYRACLDSHDVCRRLVSQEHFTPSRLIDVGGEGSDTWKLCLYPEDIHDRPDYMTLSYRWAQTPAVTLRASTIEEFRRGAAIGSLPKTFRDAVTVAWRFSVRYLWIDSLCIVQDSAEDWARESVRMHSVYANSVCNIAASASDTPDGGLFRSRSPEDVLYGRIDVQISPKCRKRFDIWDQFYMDRLTEGPLSRRGWVFQERVLSPRVLHFSNHQIVWECFEMEKCETFPKFSPYPAEAVFPRRLKTVSELAEMQLASSSLAEEDKAMSVGVYHQWTHLVQAYSQCSLTCTDDKLIAMSGIAEMFEKSTGDEYLAGLWRSRLVQGLLWVVVDPVAPPQNRLRAPSWSWVAVDSPVLPQTMSNLGSDYYLVDVVDAKVERPHSSSEWKHVRGSVRLRGCVTKLTVSKGGRRTSRGENVALEAAGLQSPLFAYPDMADTTWDDDAVLHVLPLRPTWRRTSRTKGDLALSLVIILEGIIQEPAAGLVDTFRRVGHFVYDRDDFSFFNLHAVPAYPGATESNRVVVHDDKTSLITLI